MDVRNSKVADTPYENPTLIQSLNRRSLKASSQALPLVLFHDGSGTIFNYFLLDQLGRDVFGFVDPKATAAEEWEGGIAEMALHYQDCMEQAIAPGAIILGGWSFGGVLALEVASIIRNNRLSPFTIAGVILIDTRCPIGAPNIDPEFEEKQGIQAVHVTPQARALAEGSMRRATRMLRKWRLPWHTGAPDDLLHCTMIRAAQQSGQASSQGSVLGWECFTEYLDLHALQVPGDHYTIFSEPNCEILSAKVKEACELTEHQGADQKDGDRSPTSAR
ncbi:hypothetical protein BST61_g4386 [Cercospora zeina]